MTKEDSETALGLEEEQRRRSSKVTSSGGGAVGGQQLTCVPVWGSGKEQLAGAIYVLIRQEEIQRLTSGESGTPLLQKFDGLIHSAKTNKILFT